MPVYVGREEKERRLTVLCHWWYDASVVGNKGKREEASRSIYFSDYIRQITNIKTKCKKPHKKSTLQWTFKKYGPDLKKSHEITE